MSILNRIRKRKIRKAAFGGQTGMRPLSAIKKAAVLIDAEDADFEECQRKSVKFFAAHKIDLKLFYIDFRKMGRDEIITTCIQTTLTRKRTNMLGFPDKEYMTEVQSCGHTLTSNPKERAFGKDTASEESCSGISGNTTADEVLFISIVHSDCPAVRMIASAMPAGFKVGILDYPQSPYNMVVTKHKGRSDDKSDNDAAIGNNSRTGSKANYDNGTLTTLEAIFKSLEQIVAQ